MPKGIVIISWDEFEGGLVSFKYPHGLDIPDNFVQLLQISHNFSPGLMTIKENNFHALSLGNEPTQKIVVLILTIYEDAEDFRDIIKMVDEVIEEIPETDKTFEKEIMRIYDAAGSVFKAREEVMIKLANEIAELKNQELDFNQILNWLIKHERGWEKRIIMHLLIHPILSFDEIQEFTKLSPKKLKKYLESMTQKKLIEINETGYHLIIQYQ